MIFTYWLGVVYVWIDSLFTLRSVVASLILASWVGSKGKSKDDVAKMHKHNFNEHDPKIKAEIQEITRIFEYYDEDGSGG
jgi:hypothetical protein